jgi:hypothetical protein
MNKTPARQQHIYRIISSPPLTDASLAFSARGPYQHDATF